MDKTNYAVFRGESHCGDIVRQGRWPYSELSLCYKCGQVYGGLMNLDPTAYFMARQGLCLRCSPDIPAGFGSYVSGSLWPWYWDTQGVDFSVNFLKDELRLHIAAEERGEL